MGCAGTVPARARLGLTLAPATATAGPPERHLHRHTAQPGRPPAQGMLHHKCPPELMRQRPHHPLEPPQAPHGAGPRWRPPAVPFPFKTALLEFKAAQVVPKAAGVGTSSPPLLVPTPRSALGRGHAVAGQRWARRRGNLVVQPHDGQNPPRAMAPYLPLPHPNPALREGQPGRREIRGHG